jgi:hypothetical protein
LGEGLESAACVLVVVFVQAERVDGCLVVDADVYSPSWERCDEKERGGFLNGMKFSIVYFSPRT